MAIKKHNWIQYGRQGGEIVEINVKDYSGAKIESWRCGDKKQYQNALKVLKQKYGFEPEVDVEESPNYNKETDWLDPNFNL